MTTKQIFRIRNSAGLFSTGGTSPKFGPKGKMWPSSGALNGHLALLTARTIQYYRTQGAQVVAYDVIENESYTETLDERIEAKHKRSADKEVARARNRAAWQREADLRELDRLRKLYQEVG